jgi:hypothetical protein
MAWFQNHYICERCDSSWSDEWSCMCDDDCPHCGARHMSPHKSDDLTGIIAASDDAFVVPWSPDTAEHDPAYYELGRFSSRQEAVAFLAIG